MENVLTSDAPESPSINSDKVAKEDTPVDSSFDLVEDGKVNDSDEDTLHAFNSSNVTVILVEDNNSVNVETDKVICNKDSDNGEACKTNSGCGGDGSDSGVELNGVLDPVINTNLQRALSNNSGGYTSSCGGNEDCTPALSCDSSIVSCCSVYDDAFEILTRRNSTLLEDLNRTGDHTSEGGSESSSVVGCDSKKSSNKKNTNSTVKKKVALSEPISIKQNRSRPTTTDHSGVVSRSRSKTGAVPKTNLTKNTTSTQRERARSKDKLNLTKTPSASSKNATRQVVTPNRTTKALPDSLQVSDVKRDVSSSRSRGTGRTPSVTKNVTSSKSSSTGPTTPTDDGRWPSTSMKTSTKHSSGSLSSVEDARWPCAKSSTHVSSNMMTRSYRGASVTSDTHSIKTRLGLVLLENNSSALEKYATLPRRKREKSPTEMPRCLKVEPSNSREPSLNRTVVVRRQLISREKDSSVNGKSLPPYPRKRGTISKTKIFHEMCIQTAVTGIDMENILAGSVSRIKRPEDVDKVDFGIQVDTQNKLIERLETQLKDLKEKNEKLKTEYDSKSKELTTLEQKLVDERDEKQAAKDELARNQQRVLDMLNAGSSGHKHDGGSDSLLVLESQFEKAGKIIINQEHEISELHSHCRVLQRDLEKSLAAQQTLLKQQQEMELENRELQEFVQAERATLTEALRDAEEDVQMSAQRLRQRDNELQRQQDECTHLVRVCEQRRQENMTLQARLGNLEARSRELLLQQGAAVSSAAVALSGLSSRLEGLVGQLVATYNISEQDLEDVIYHNEAYSNSGSSMEGSPDKSMASRKSNASGGSASPKRGASFVSAVISAIRNAAAQAPFAGTNNKTANHAEPPLSECDTSDSAELLDSETEPVLMMESVLEDVVMPDTHSHNMVSSSHSLMTSSRLGHSESLHNLSQAIITRHQQEQEMSLASTADMAGSLSEYCPAITLVDQVIEVDNHVTRLLKVLRIIQIENDTYIDELQDERNVLSEQVQKQREACESAAKQLKEWECMGSQLKKELSDVTQQLAIKAKELDDTKAELTEHRQEIERLNQDVCKLSTLCTQTELQLCKREEEANATLKQWQETGKLPSADVLARLVTARHEIPILKEKLREKEQQLTQITEKYSASHQVMTESWSQAVNETRRQYEAIDNALEILLSIQNVVEQCPPLAKLQRDLEETSFQCASSLPLPIVSADCNANANHRLDPAPATPINGTA